MGPDKKKVCHGDDLYGIVVVAVVVVVAGDRGRNEGSSVLVREGASPDVHSSGLADPHQPCIIHRYLAITQH